MMSTSDVIEAAQVAPNMGRFALRYAEQGFRVLPVHGLVMQDGTLSCDCSLGGPCTSPGKHPLIREWDSKASSDVGVVRRWWLKWPNANIGLLCGVDFDVLDVDGPEGAMAIADSVPSLDVAGLEALATVTTGRGFHIYLEPGGVSMAKVCSPKAQLQSVGHYVIAPPSLHRTGRRYAETARGLDPVTSIIPMPDWLVALAGGQASSGYDFDPADIPAPMLWTSSPAYAAAALDQACLRISTELEGARNNVLNEEAFCIGRFVWSGDLQLRTFLQRLGEAGRASGLEDDEISGVLDRALEASHRVRQRPNR